MKKKVPGIGDHFWTIYKFS